MWLRTDHLNHAAWRGFCGTLQFHTARPLLFRSCEGSIRVLKPLIERFLSHQCAVPNLIELFRALRPALIAGGERPVYLISFLGHLGGCPAICAWGKESTAVASHRRVLYDRLGTSPALVSVDE